MKNKHKILNIYEVFAGLGSQIEAIKTNNIPYSSKGYIEWFVPAIIAYEIIHYGTLKQNNIISKEKIINFLNKYKLSFDSKKPCNNNKWKKMNESILRQIYPYIYRSIIKHGNQVNINDAKSIPDDIDLLTYSFPCQDLSQQGKQKGIKSGTRSGLLLEIERLLSMKSKSKLPKILMLENVSALASSKFINDLEKWINKLNTLGYHSEWKILNSSQYGSMQNRKRVIMFSILNNKESVNWPDPKNNDLVIKDIINNSNTDFLNKFDKYKLDVFHKTKNNIIKSKLLNYSNFNSETYVYKIEGKGPTLTASGANSRLKLYINGKIRYMAVDECFYYMGFKKWQFDKIKNTNLISNNQIIFLSGNSIPVPLLSSLFLEVIKNDNKI